MSNKPIRVLYIIGGGEFGGAEQHVLSLMKGFEASAVTPQVACFYDALFAKRVQQAEIPVTSLGQGVFKSFQILRKIIHNFRPQIIHTHGVRANVLGRIVGKGFGIPLITTVHSCFALDYPKYLKRTIFYTLEKATRPAVHTYIAVSRAMKKDLVEQHVHPKKIQVIYNGIDTTLFVPGRKAQRDAAKQHTANDDRPVVLTVARLHPVKGHKDLLQAIEHVQTPARYVFVGDGEMRPELESIIRERSLPVDMVGHQDAIVPFYQQADLVVQPSISEGFSLSMAEALACGVPVVATRVGGCIEIASHVKSGASLVKAGDPLELAAGIDRMLQQPEMPDRKAIERMFSIQQMCEHTYNLYERVAKHHK
ncbi:glycosyltransferase [Fodinisporobacter ferrooxydans]|uniref:Glycosyltransferase n=1 Tax=Fodinisporobacter ferrooxydans TaxID=2901836 RepID=A0ABY4CND7_9BACL|nr:glycosyltransferase [Alicyclobacillaceae bacterium MYW30-H2]